eukprot:1122102-Pelagomonas_calceolata.AAC.2
MAPVQNKPRNEPKTSIGQTEVSHVHAARYMQPSHNAVVHTPVEQVRKEADTQAACHEKGATATLGLPVNSASSQAQAQVAHLLKHQGHEAQG